MLLQQIMHFNDLSPELRKKLEEKISGFGKTVRYKFDISHPNPDPTFHNGKVIWPHLYTLDPAVFNINDPFEKRENKQRSKRIALVDGIDDKGLPNRFIKIRLNSRDQGILRLELQDNPEHFDYAMFIELHPKLIGGMFVDSTKKQVITRIDEQAAAKQQREERGARSKARKAAEELSPKGVIDFADAMMWDSSQNEEVLRNQIEELAETTPEFFNDLISGKSIEFQAAVKQAINKGVIMFDPSEYKFSWSANKQTIAVLGNIPGKNEIERMAEWLQGAGKKEEEVYKKIKSLIGEKELANV